MIKRYLDFEIKIYSDGHEIEIDIDGRPRGFSLPHRLKLPLMLQPISYKTLTPDPAAIASAGHSLFESIFCEEVETAFASYLNRRTESEGVRICIYTQSNSLGELVWELLCNRLQPAINYLALDPKTPVIRITRVGTEMYERELKLPLKMLIVSASPGSLPQIDREKEKSLIDEALRDAIAQGLIDIEYLGFDEQSGVNYDSLQEKLAGETIPYDVVHVLAHGLLETGEEGEVALSRPEDGKLQIVNASSFAGIFRERGVMLVVLQSCRSGAVDPTVNSFSSVAQQLVASGVPAVLAMQDVVDQDVAANFIGKLYKQWIGTGAPFEDALTQARQSLSQKYQDRIAPWAIPVFYIVPGLQLILRQPASPKEVKNIPVPVQTAATEWQVDAALPRQMRLEKETDLLVLIRTPSAPGLREKLGGELRDFEATPDDVSTAPTFDVEFKRDGETGRPLPFVVKITIEAKNFELDRTEVRVQVRPQGDSVFSVFPITAKVEGPGKIWLRVLDTSEQEVTLAELLLRTNVRTGETFETEYLVTKTILTPFGGKTLKGGSSSTHVPTPNTTSNGGAITGRNSDMSSHDPEPTIDADPPIIVQGHGNDTATVEREEMSTGSAAGGPMGGSGVPHLEGDENRGSTTGTASRQSRMVTGIFSDRESAERAYALLSTRGYSKDDIILLMSDETRKTHFSSDDAADTDLGSKALEGAGAGAAIGGTTGAVLAAIAAIGTSVVLPGLGLTVAGPLAAALAGAGAGGATGGLIGALVGSGIPEDRAKVYEEGVRNGSLVIGVYARSDEDAEYFENEFKTHRGEYIYR